MRSPFQLPIFSPAHIFDDCLHTVYLGFGLIFVSSSIVAFCYWGWFGGGSLEKRLQRAGKEWVRWCYCNGYQTTVRHLSRKALSFLTSAWEPDLTAKGMDIKCPRNPEVTQKQLEGSEDPERKHTNNTEEVKPR